MTRLLDDPDGIVRAAAIRALGTLHATTVVEQLIALLSFDAPSETEVHTIVRAIKVLGELGDPRAVAPLLDLFWRLDRSSYAYEIASALRALHDPSVVEPLLQRLPTAQGTRPWHIISLLEHFRDPRAVEPLLALLDVRATERLERKFQVRVIEALGVLGDPRAIEPLRAAFPQTTDEVHAAIWNTLRGLEIESEN